MKITTQVPYVHTPKNLSVKNDGAENLEKITVNVYFYSTCS